MPLNCHKFYMHFFRCLAWSSHTLWCWSSLDPRETLCVIILMAHMPTILEIFRIIDSIEQVKIEYGSSFLRHVSGSSADEALRRWIVSHQLSIMMLTWCLLEPHLPLDRGSGTYWDSVGLVTTYVWWNSFVIKDNVHKLTLFWVSTSLANCQDNMIIVNYRLTMW